MVAYTNLSCEDIHHLLDNEVSSLSQPWDGTILFPVYVVEDMKSFTESIFHSPPEEVDICSYLSAQKYPTERLYFSPSKYIPPQHEGAMSSKEGGFVRGWIDLKRDLEIASIEAGHTIISNGGKPGNRRLVCGCMSRPARRSYAMEVTQENPYREVSLINNRKNNRPDGIKGPRKSKTKASQDQTKLCQFYFVIEWDMHGFYVKLKKRSGCSTHSFHPRIFEKGVLPFPSRLLTKEQIENTTEVVKAAASKAVGRNFLRGKYGKFINSIKINYLYSKDDDGKSSKLDDISRMLDDFKNAGEIAFTSLSDVPLSDLTESLYDERLDHRDETVTISTLKEDGGEVVNYDSSMVTGLKELEELAKKERVERKMDKNDVLFIAIGWIVLPAFRYFKLCPEVIWCDVTSHSNNKGFHLLTFSCRTSVDKQVVFLWLWMPNQQRFSFRWVFQHAIPNLIPKWLRDRVTFIMKDGDAQQHNEIKQALRNVFVNAQDGNCGFHIGKTTLFMYVC